MATASDEYWHEYLRDEKAEHKKEALQWATLKENAAQVVTVSEHEREELVSSLLTCDGETRSWLSPMIDVPFTHYLLYGVLCEEKRKNSGNEKDVQRCFQRRLKEDKDLIQKLNGALDALDDSAQRIRSTFEAARRCATAPPPTVDNIREAVERRKGRTWKDVPEKELAERLSKGEIIPRDDWIPGISEGRRKLNKIELESHLNFGRRLHKEGNEAYADNNFDLASTRYVQGVNLLNWVEGDCPESTKGVDDLLLTFLKNHAAAALKLGEYRTAQEAATSALVIDEHDSKARFRRAKAYMLLGELPAAKSDYVKILKSAYSTTDDHVAARDGLREIRGIVTKWKTNIKNLMDTVSEQETFSSDRPLSSEVLPCPPPSAPRQLERPLPLPAATNRVIQCSPSSLSKEETQYILHQILEVYTSDEVQKQLNQIRRDVDLDERKVLIRARKYLPEFIGHVLKESSLPGADFVQKKLALDKAVQYWRLNDEKVKILADGIYKAFLGDCVDEA